MTDVPALNPDTIPSVPMVAAVVLVLAQVPPVNASVNAEEVPTHKIRLPVIGGRSVLTVTVVVYTVPGLQPLPVLLTTNEYTPVTVGVIAGL